MRSFRVVLALALGLAGLAMAADPADSAGELKKKAEANWEAVGAGKAVLHETKHFLLCAPEAMAKRLKDVGELLEKHHDKAKEALKFEVKEEDKGEVLPGKVVVYLFDVSDPFKAFVRRIEGRRLEAGETASFQAADDKLHVAVSPPRGKRGLPVEVQACEQTAALLLARRAGTRTPLPDWVVSGFGRATYYRVAPNDKAVKADRLLAANLSRKHGINDVWDGKVSADEAETLQGSLMDFLAYGPGSRVFPKFVAGFEPSENMERKTASQAFEAAGLMPDKIITSWQAWARNAR
ncbi:MAG TPA: hypothetical protein VH682_31220 [Gemmataceae bacterium]|jgi:hypothetical protein